MTDEPDALAAVLLSADPRTDLARLVLTDPALLAVRRAAQRQLGAVRLEPGSPAAVLLLAISGHPGLSAAELAAVTGLDVTCPGRELLDAGLVTSSRFERSDCWARTASGAQEAARLR